jgi:uridine kinase/adenylate cyclase class IV
LTALRLSLRIYLSHSLELEPLPTELSFEKGLFVVVRAIQLLAAAQPGRVRPSRALTPPHKRRPNNACALQLIVVGLAGPSGAGKTELSRRLHELTPLAVLSLGASPFAWFGSSLLTARLSADAYLNTAALVDGNYDDPRLTDFDALEATLADLRAGRPARVPQYDFKQSRRVGFTPLEPPASGVVLVEGLYALHERVRPWLDLSVSVHGVRTRVLDIAPCVRVLTCVRYSFCQGVHFDLIKRIQRDVARCGQTPQEIIAQISETVFPMFKAYVEPDLAAAAIRIRNSFNPFGGFLSSATYTLKSRAAAVDREAVRTVLARSAGSRATSPLRTAEPPAPPVVDEEREETVDLYLMPPGEDAETCRDWIRMRLRDGRYSLLFEEYISDADVLISPSMSFEVPVRTLSGLMALGYSLGAIIRRDSLVMRCEGLTAKYDTITQLGQSFFQIEGRDRGAVERAAEALGLAGTYVPRSYIELVQLGRLVSECAPRLEDCGFLPPAVAASMAAPQMLPPTPARASSGLAPTSPGGTRLHTRPHAGATPGATPMRPAEASPMPQAAPPAATARRSLRMDVAAVAEASSSEGSDGGSAVQDAPQPQLTLWEHGSFSSAASGSERRSASAAPPPRPASQPPRLPSSQSAPGASSLEDKLAWLEARVHAMAWSALPPPPAPPLWRHAPDEVRFVDAASMHVLR